jgi:hypothetical protein
MLIRQGYYMEITAREVTAHLIQAQFAPLMEAAKELLKCSATNLCGQCGEQLRSALAALDKE